MARDRTLFYLLREPTLPPLFLLVCIRGIRPQRRYAAVKYTLMMLAGGVPLLLGCMLPAFSHAGMNGIGSAAGPLFSYPELLAGAGEIAGHRVLSATGFCGNGAGGRGARCGVFPRHLWQGLPRSGVQQRGH